MADTSTANFNWVKPEVGASPNTWGSKWNANLDAIDTQMKAAMDAAAAAQVRADNTIKKDGSIKMEANLDMGGDHEHEPDEAVVPHKILNVAPGTLDTDAATFAQARLWQQLSQAIKSANYAVLLADAGSLIIGNHNAAIVFTLPAVATATGRVFHFGNTGTDTVTLDPNASEQIDGAATRIVPPGSMMTIRSDGTAWQVVIVPRRATQAEAEAGTATEVYTDPLRVRQAGDVRYLPLFAMAPLIGLIATVPTTASVNVKCKFAGLTDGTLYRGVKDIDLTAAFGTVGAGGLDTGAEAANTWYYGYIIQNPTTNALALILSTNANAPTLPSGYTFYRRVCTVRNNASSNLIVTKQVGNRIYYTANQTAFATGSASGSVIGLPNHMPPTAVMAIVKAQKGYSGQDSVMRIGPTATNNMFIEQEETALGSGGRVFSIPTIADIPLDTIGIYYYVSFGSAAAAYILGWVEDF